MAFTELVGHQLVLIPLLLTRVQLLRQDQEGFCLTLQLLLANHELRDVFGRQEDKLSHRRKDVVWCGHDGTHAEHQRFTLICQSSHGHCTVRAMAA